jgi:hypothetical protein
MSKTSDPVQQKFDQTHHFLSMALANDSYVRLEYF